jgi:hypothetical protein
VALTEDEHGKGFAFFAHIRVRWRNLSPDCRGVHCHVIHCGVKALAKRYLR